MANFEAKIRTRIGEITIHFDDKADLNSKSRQINDFIDVLTRNNIVIYESKLLPGMGDIYTLTADGRPRLLKVPDSEADTIKLMLYVTSDALSNPEISSLTGINNPKDYIVGSHFSKTPEGHTMLSVDGYRFVTLTLIPRLREEVDK